MICAFYRSEEIKVQILLKVGYWPEIQAKVSLVSRRFRGPGVALTSVNRHIFEHAHLKDFVSQHNHTRDIPNGSQRK